jgi:hypothetical protein
MGLIPEQIVAEVVARTSERMAKDPAFPQLAVGSFVQSHPDVSRYVTANSDTLGGEGVIHVVFHAEVMAECFRSHLARDLPAVDFATLDAAASGEGEIAERLRQLQPALSGYLESNVDDEPLRQTLALIAIAFDKVARA